MNKCECFQKKKRHYRKRNERRNRRSKNNAVTGEELRWKSKYPTLQK
jgi:hypothetical protein